jgi:hypothetical protein
MSLLHLVEVQIERLCCQFAVFVRPTVGEQDPADVQKKGLCWFYP